MCVYHLEDVFDFVEYDSAGNGVGAPVGILGHSLNEFSAEALVDSLDRNDYIAVKELLFMKEDMFPQDWEAIVSELEVVRPWLLYSVEPNRSKNFTWSNEQEMWVDSTFGIDIPFEDDIPF